MLAQAVYVLCALTSIACALLLLRGYRTTRTRLLFWASLCFMFLAVNNVLLLLDYITPPTITFAAWRNGTALAGLFLLIFGLTWESS
jgi:hypothetical protein